MAQSKLRLASVRIDHMETRSSRQNVANSSTQRDGEAALENGPPSKCARHVSKGVRAGESAGLAEGEEWGSGNVEVMVKRLKYLARYRFLG